MDHVPTTEHGLLYIQIFLGHKFLYVLYMSEQFTFCFLFIDSQRKPRINPRRSREVSVSLNYQKIVSLSLMGTCTPANVSHHFLGKFLYPVPLGLVFVGKVSLPGTAWIVFPGVCWLGLVQICHVPQMGGTLPVGAL
jgi:hypothetical protein